MNIGTISLNINTHDFNYGALLHSWAFQQWLKRQNCVSNTEVIDYITPMLEKHDRDHPIKSALRERHLRTFVKNLVYSRPYKERLDKFNTFIDNNLEVSKEKYTHATLDSADLSYDTVICESDVIWSPDFFGGKLDYSFFLACNSMRNMNKIAYSPSMGDGVIDKSNLEEIKRYLEGINHISCRESYDVPILQSLTSKQVTHVVDPVLLLGENDYEEIVAQRIIKKHYALLYLPVDDNKVLRENAYRYCKENGLAMIEIATNLEQTKAPDVMTLTNAGIEEFLSGIKYADIIFTNSFHAICFAVIYKKEFYAFNRGSSGKVKDICKVLGMPERFFDNNEFAPLNPINYDSVYERLKEMRSKSVNWLNYAINTSGGTS